MLGDAQLTRIDGRLELIEKRQECVIEAINGLSDVVEILGERITELVDLCAPVEPPAGEESLPVVLAKLLEAVNSQTAALGVLLEAVQQRGG
jgi:hypothetical protein